LRDVKEEIEKLEEKGVLLNMLKIKETKKLFKPNGKFIWEQTDTDTFYGSNACLIQIKNDFVEHDLTAHLFKLTKCLIQPNMCINYIDKEIFPADNDLTKIVKRFEEKNQIPLIFANTFKNIGSKEVAIFINEENDEEFYIERKYFNIIDSTVADISEEYDITTDCESFMKVQDSEMIVYILLNKGKYE